MDNAKDGLQIMFREQLEHYRIWAVREDAEPWMRDYATKQAADIEKALFQLEACDG